MTTNQEEKDVVIRDKEPSKEENKEDKEEELIYDNELPVDWATPQIIVSVGKPKRGKSNSTKYFILKNSLERKIYSFGICFTKTKFNNDYDYLPDDYVFQGWDSSKLQQYLSGLEQMENRPRNFVILDDLVSVIDRNEPTIASFISTHRHYNTDIYINTQYLYASVNTPLFRECTSVCLMFMTKMRKSIKGLYECYGQLFDDEEEFKQHLLNTTKEKYVAMVYIADIDDLEENYVEFLAPNMSKVKYKLDY